MDLEEEYQKKFQFNPNIYCIAKKPFLSFKFNVAHYFEKVYLNFQSYIFQKQKGSKLDSEFGLMAYDYVHPLISLSISPLKTFLLAISGDQYSVSMGPEEKSIFLNFSYSPNLSYRLLATFGKSPSIVGSINNLDDALSLHIYKKNLSLFYKLTIEELGIFYSGFKFKNSNSFFERFTHFLSSIEMPAGNHLISISSELSETIGITLSDKIGNHSIHYYFRNIPVSRSGTLFKNYCHLQYKYKTRNKNKIGFLYDFDDDSIFTRGSLLISNRFKLKASLKYKEGNIVDKSFGVVFNLFK